MRAAAVDWRLAAPLGIVYLALFAAPLLLLLGISLHADQDLQQWGLDNWTKFWGDAFYRGVVWDTLRLGVAAVLATSLFAWPLAVFFCNASPRTQKILIFIILLPLLTSVVIRTFAWIVILAREGLVNQVVLSLGLSATPLRLLQTETGLILALMQIEMPLMLLPLISVMRGLDPNLLDASRALGAGMWRGFFRVILPLSLPELIAPAETVAGGEHLHRQPGDELNETFAVFHGQFHPARRILGAENLGQFLRRKACGHAPRILQPERWREFLAVIERHGHAVLRRDEEIVLQQKPSKQQPMPLVVGGLLDEVLDLVRSAFGLALGIAELFCLGLKLLTVTPQLFVHVLVRIGLMNREGFKCFACAPFGNLTRLLDRAFQLSAKRRGKTGHRITGPCFSWVSTWARTPASHWSRSAEFLMVAPGS